MPNVMGREFPYTPEGMAQAEQYKQAMGMRGGGMMGFRPLGYANGDLVTAMAQRPRTKDFDSAYKPLVQKLYRIMSNGTDQQVRDFINSNRDMLNQATTIDDKMFNMLREVLPLYPPPEILGEASPSSNIIPAGIRVAPRDPDEGFYADPTYPQQPLPQFGDDFSDDFSDDSIPYYNPNQLNPFFNPDDIEVADGGYISRKMNRGGIMSLRGY
jgi:hypothetical protein